MSETANGMPKVLAVVVADFERAAIGTRSRLLDSFRGRTVIEHVISRTAQVKGVGEIALLVPENQQAKAAGLHFAGPTPCAIHTLMSRPDSIAARVRIGRAWNLLAWRGGAGQWTYFDEEFHPAAIAAACKGAFGGSGADHVLIVHSHAALLDVEITSALVHHHLYKNHEMRVTYTPAAPGLSGMVLRADIVAEMGEKNVLPWQLLGYDPKAPSFDTLIREACMQVDPALSKIPNRFCLDTQRAWECCAELPAVGSAAELCLAAARTVAPGVKELSRAYGSPREVQVDLTMERLAQPPGAVPRELRERLGKLDARHWTVWLSRQRFADDLLLTIGADGDPLLYEGLLEVLRDARAAQPLSICVQTDLAGGDFDALLAAIDEDLIDVLTVTMYGHSRETYAKVAGADVHGVVMGNMQRVAERTVARGGMPLVIPRLLKVRETIPELEPFFDTWISACGWAVIDAPTDRAGAVPFKAVVDMAPPKRRACRRIWDRLVLRADGSAVACDQDVAGKLRVGHVETASVVEMWNGLSALRAAHAAGEWNRVSPCDTCKEWHRA